MTSRIEDARVSREYREYVMALAVVAGKLNRLTTDEVGYNATYEREFIPIQMNCQKSIGSELTTAVIRDAYTLARLA